MNKKLMSLTLAAVLAMGAACSCKKAFVDDDKNSGSSSNSSSVTPNTSGSTETAQNNSQTVDGNVDKVVSESPDDFAFNKSTSNKIIGKGSRVEVQGTGVDASGSVATISKSGNYIVEGSLSDGQIVVDLAKDDAGTVKIILNGMDFASSTGAALYVDDCEKVSVLIADGSSNKLTSTYSGADSLACVHSKQSIFVSADDKASGSLYISASTYEGLKSKDGIVIKGGNINVTSTKDNAIQGKDYVKIDGGKITANGGKHAIKASSSKTDMGFVYITGGELNLTGANDGIHAVGTVQVKDGTFKISASDDGISSESHITIDGGSFADITTQDKGINANGTITINGGNFNILKSDKCISADGDITINDGTLVLSPTATKSGESGSGHGITTKKLDDTGLRVGNVTINGGNIDITKSYEGIQGVVITINGGFTKIVSLDDAINASTGASQMGGGGFGRPGQWGPQTGSSSSTVPALIVNDGFVYAVAQGDGLDSNGEMKYKGGIVLVSQYGNANEPLDAGDGYEVEISGGVVVAVGTQGMARAPKSSQTAFFTTTSATANSVLAVNNSEGKNILAWKVPQAYQVITFSAPGLSTGTYTYITKATVSGKEYVDGSGFYYPAESVSGTGTDINLTAGSITSTSSNQGGRPW